MEDVQVVAMLVRRCIAGDAAAWEEIVQTYNRRIYNICYRFAEPTIAALGKHGTNVVVRLSAFFIALHRNPDCMDRF